MAVRGNASENWHEVPSVFKNKLEFAFFLA
jgi:hypothetical protein